MSKNGETTTVCPISTKERSDKEAPDGWSWKRLDSVARLESGHTPSRKVPAYWDGGDVPWLSLKDIKGLSTAYVNETVNTPTMEGIDNSSARILPKDTVAFCRTASVGNVAILGRDMATSQDFVNWVCSDELDPKFLYWALKNSGREFDKEKQGATHKTIYMPTVKRFHVLLPTLSEQKRIAGILDKADSIVRKRQQAIGLTEQFLRSTFLDMFGDPVTNPKGWPVAPLAKIASRVTVGHVGGVSDWYSDDGVIMLRTGNVGYLRIKDAEVLRIERELHDKLTKSQIQSGDVIVTRHVMNEIQCAVIPPTYPEANCLNIILVRPGEALDSYFLASLICTNASQDQLLKRKVGTAQAVVNTTAMKEWEIPVPPLEQQRNFGDVAAKLLQFEDGLGETQLASENLFNSLVQRAFRGEL